MLEAFDKGLLAVTLRYPYEVRSQGPYFEDIPELKLPVEMKELAAHLVDSKAAHFDPTKFEDHYQTGLLDMLNAKQAGRAIEAPSAPAPHRVLNLMDALRASIGEPAKKPPAAAAKARPRAGAKRKAGN